MTEITIEKIEDLTEVNAFLERYTRDILPIEQTPPWSVFEENEPGREALGFYGAYQGGNKADGKGGTGKKLLAMFHVVFYESRGRSFIWLKNGPLWNVDNVTLQQEQALCNSLAAYDFGVTAKGKKISPDFIRAQMRHEVKGRKEPYDSSTYDATITVATCPDQYSVEDIFASFTSNARRSVRKAGKFDVTVERVTENKSSYFENNLYSILEETTSRSGFRSHHAKTYVRMLKALKDHARLYVALVEKKPVAWAIVTTNVHTWTYYYGASNIVARETSAPYALHWQAIQDAHAAGAQHYDFMGIGSEKHPELLKLTTFKKYFNKEKRDVVETFDIPLRRAKYKAATTAISAKRASKNALGALKNIGQSK